LGESPEAAIGKPLEWNMWGDTDTIKRGKVIAVVKDFHYNSLHEEVQTSVLQIYPDSYWKLALRVDAKDLSQTIAGIQKTWDSFNTLRKIDFLSICH
jgi:putative ABC transport system permease protein